MFPQQLASPTAVELNSGVYMEAGGGNVAAKTLSNGCSSATYVL